MYNQFAQSEIESIEAAIQSRIGEFLAAKSKLIMMSRSPILTISDQAMELLESQKQLEVQLAETLFIIEKVKSDAYSISDILSAGAFYAMMEKHLYSVSDLESDYAEMGGKAVAPSNTNLWIIAAVAIGVYAISKQRRR